MTNKYSTVTLDAQADLDGNGSKLSKHLIILHDGAVQQFDDPIIEDDPTNPVNVYGNTKLAVDRMLGDECRAHGLAAVSLRYFNVAGASGPLGEDHHPETHLIPLVLQAASGRRESVAIFGTDYDTPDGTAIRPKKP